MQYRQREFKINSTRFYKDKEAYQREWEEVSRLSENSHNHHEIIDKKQWAADQAAAEERTRKKAFERRHEIAARRPPKHLSPTASNNRNVGFIVLDV